MNSVVSGRHLKVARLIYGYATQEELGKELDKSLGTIQRYESAEEVDAKTLGVYMNELHFDIPKIVMFMEKAVHERNVRKDNGKFVPSG